MDGVGDGALVLRRLPDSDSSRLGLLPTVTVGDETCRAFSFGGFNVDKMNVVPSLHPIATRWFPGESTDHDISVVGIAVEHASFILLPLDDRGKEDVVLGRQNGATRGWVSMDGKQNMTADT